MIHTTLNEIRAFNPSKSAWSRLLSHLGKTAADDEPLPLVTVLDSHGLEGTIWCLRVCPDIAAEFARWCADRTDDPAKVADWASHWASCWAADWAAEVSERQAQADKLRELLS